MVYVFGNPITDETLKGMAGYQGKTITLKDRARVALLMKNSEDKDVKVRQQAEKFMLKAGAATVCLIYNATGDTLTFVTSCDWSGQIGHAPYPPRIENGQWGAFLHLRNPAAPDVDSVGAVVYRGKNEDGQDRDWMQAWANKKPNNKAYSEVREVGHWTTNFANDIWGVVYDKMSKSSIISTEINGGCSIVGIGNDSCSVFEAILMHLN